MVDVSAALSSVTAAFAIAKSAIEARDTAKVRAAIADLETKLHGVTSAALASAEKAAALQSKLNAAERENAELRAAAQDRARYALHELQPGTFVYASKPPDDGGGPPVHYLCQNCYDKGIKSILRRIDGGEYMPRTWVCAEKKEHSFFA